jgi:hypothetical protein
LLQKLMPDNGAKDATRRNALIVVAALALLGALGWYLAHVLSEARACRIACFPVAPTVHR